MANGCVAACSRMLSSHVGSVGHGAASRTNRFATESASPAINKLASTEDSRPRHREPTRRMSDTLGDARSPDMASKLDDDSAVDRGGGILRAAECERFVACAFFVGFFRVEYE